MLVSIGTRCGWALTYGRLFFANDVPWFRDVKSSIQRCVQPGVIPRHTLFDPCHEGRSAAIAVSRIQGQPIPEPTESVLSTLLRRGSRAEDLSDVLPIVAGMTPISLGEVIDDVFRAREGTDWPFRAGRFSDGSLGVYYSAFDEGTCREEIAYHLHEAVVKTDHDPGPRSFRVIECRCDGTTANLLGKETKHQDLVSVTRSGYPFCLDLGRKSVDRGLDGFLTASARKPDGVCVGTY